MTASLARGFDLDPRGGLPALVVLVLDLDLAALAEVREAAGYVRLLELAAVQPDSGPLGYRDGSPAGCPAQRDGPTFDIDLFNFPEVCVLAGKSRGLAHRDELFGHHLAKRQGRAQQERDYCPESDQTFSHNTQFSVLLVLPARMLALIRPAPSAVL